MRRAVAALVLLLCAAPALAQDAGQIDVTKLSKVPRQTKFVEAEYPKAAAEKGIEAEVVLLLDIDEKGQVTAAGIDTPADPPGMGFDEAAMLAAQSWEFEPAELDGKPIAIQITYRYRFTLKPKEAPATQPAAEQPPPARPKTVSLAGRLQQRGTRLPMAGVVVTVFRDDVQPPLGFEATTDEDGRFELYDLAPGPWKVLVEAPGYYPFRTTETIAAGERVDVSYHVEKGSYNPYDVTVTAERPKKEVSRTILPAAEIDKVPGGAGDPLTVVQNFAGVARLPNPALLVVRGSAPEDSRVFVEGIGVPFIWHFGGLKSVLPIGVLQSIEFYPGNFSPMYGRATGGIVDVRIKELKPEKIGGYADISILDTGLYLEIPIGKKGGIALAGRRSYLDAILSLVIPDDAGVSLRTAPRYYDFQLVGSYRPARAHDLRLFAFGSDDRFELLFDNPAELDPTLTSNDFNNSTTFYRGILEYRYLPGPGFENSLKLSVGHDSIGFSAGQQLRFDLDITTFQVRDLARARLGDRLALSFGVDAGLALNDVFVRAPRPPKEGEPMTNIDLGDTVTTQRKGDEYWQPSLFAEAEVKPFPALTLFPGVRLDYFDLTGQTSLQPRLTARWQATPTVVVKGGAGLFVQEPTFEEVNPDFGNPDLGVERALHTSLGVEWKPWAFLTLDATGFYKRLDDLVSKTDEVVMEGDTFRPLIYDNGGSGRVYGVELQARHELSHDLTGWLTYTLSRAERRDSGSSDDRLFDFDQTHIFNLVLNYQLPRNWLIGGRFRLVSGNPTTPVIGSVFNASTDRYDPVYGAVNSARTGMFHQLDVRVDKRWIFPEVILNVYLDIQNIYNRENPEGIEYNFDYSQSRPLTGLPILTILGIRGEF